MSDDWCPTCGARPDAPCVTTSGNWAPKPHRQRGKPRRTIDDIPASARDAVRRRSLGLCEAKTIACTRRATQIHHKLPRGRGGRHDVENLLHVCNGCHDWVEDNRALAYDLGLLTRSGLAR